MDVIRTESGLGQRGGATHEGLLPETSGNFRTLQVPQLLSDDLRLSAQTLAVEGKREVHAILGYANSMKTTRWDICTSWALFGIFCTHCTHCTHCTQPVASLSALQLRRLSTALGTLSVVVSHVHHPIAFVRFPIM